MWPRASLPHLARLVGVDVEALELQRASTSARSRSRRARRRADRAQRPTRRCESGGCTGTAADGRRTRCGCSRARGDRAVEHLGVRAVRVLLEEVVLHGPERVEADLVAEDRLLEGVLVRLVLLARRQGLRDRDLVEQRKLHASPRRLSRERVSVEHTFVKGLRDKVAVVTGAASGLGAATRGPSRRARVAIVVGLDVDESTARGVPRRDVTDEAAVGAAIDAVAAEHGRLDVVATFAGVAGRRPGALGRARGLGPRDRASTSPARSSSCKHALRHMVEQRSGSIINVASVEGVEGTEGGSVYNASKGARRAAHQEHGHRLRAARHPGQLRLPRASSRHADVPVGDGIREHGAVPRRVPRAPQARPVRATRRDRGGGRCSSRPTTPRSSPATRSLSTAASPPGCAPGSPT